MSIVLILSILLTQSYPLRIHIAPVGFEIDRIVIPAVEKRADKVYLLVHNKQSEDKAGPYIKEVKKQLKAAKIESELAETNWRDIESITKTARELIMVNQDNHIFINLASGSKNHAIALDRAVMTFQNNDNIHMFYAESKKYRGFSFPQQLSTGVRETKDVPNHRMVIPSDREIQTMRMIYDYYADYGHGIKKKELANKCEEAGIIQVNAALKNESQVKLSALDKGLIKPLKRTWKAVHEEPVGRNKILTLTEEGEYLVKILSV